MSLLDDVNQQTASGERQPDAALDAIRQEWLIERQGRKHFDWRYYLVRYPRARSSMGEGYFHNPGYDEKHGGFRYGQLRMLYGSNYNAYFSDALLQAAWIDGNLSAVANEPRWWRRDDPGMGMRSSAVEVRCAHDGLELVLPADDAVTTASALSAIQPFPEANENRILVEREDRDGTLIDIEDRVQLCIGVARALHEAGL